MGCEILIKWTVVLCVVSCFLELDSVVFATILKRMMIWILYTLAAILRVLTPFDQWFVSFPQADTSCWKTSGKPHRIVVMTSLWHDIKL